MTWPIEGGVLGEIDDNGGMTSGDDQIWIGSSGDVDNDRPGGVEMGGGGDTLTNNGSKSPLRPLPPMLL